MGVEEILVEGVPLSDPIGSTRVGEVGVPEQARHPDSAYQMSARQSSSEHDDGSCDHHPKWLVSKGSVSGDVSLESSDERSGVFECLSDREGVSDDERNPSEIVPAVHVLSPAQVRLEYQIGSFEDGLPQRIDLRRLHVAVDFNDRIKHFGLES